MSMGEMPAVLVPLPRASRHAGAPFSALVASDRVSVLTIPAAGRRASVSPLAMASVACVAPLWMGHEAVPLDPRRTQCVPVQTPDTAFVASFLSLRNPPAGGSPPSLSLSLSLTCIHTYQLVYNELKWIWLKAHAFHCSAPLQVHPM